LRMRQVESQRVDPLEYLKSIKQASSDLGLSQSTRSEIDLKLEEMREIHDIEMAKFGLETRKWEWQKSNEGKTLEQVKDLVKTVGEGPIGDAIKMIGGAQADKMRGSATKQNSPRIVQIKCPNCGGIFAANDQLAKLICPLCGAQLEKPSQPAPQQPQQQAIQESQTQTEQPPAEEKGVAE